MSIIDRYVARSFLGSYIILLAVGFGLYVFSDVLVNFDEFTERGNLSVFETLSVMADYYGPNLALYFAQLGGVVMAIAAGFTFALMLKNNELTALVAAGMPLQRLAVPVLFSSVGLVGLWVANNELLIPQIAVKIARQHDDLTGTRTKGVHCVRDANQAVFSAAEFFPLYGQANRVVIIEPDAQHQPVALLTADTARWEAERRTWRLENGRRMSMAPAFSGELAGAIRYEGIDEYPFGLAPAEVVLRQSARWVDLMSVSQMNALVQQEGLPNLPAIVRSRDVRFTKPLLMWILIMLATPFFLTRAPTNVLVAGGRALLVAGACFAVTFVAHSVSMDNPLGRLATAVPVMVFGPWALISMANIKT